MIPIHRILVATDLSPASLEALPLACDFAEAFHAELLLLHVLELPVSPSMVEGTMAGDLESVRAAARAHAQQELEGMLARHVPAAIVRRALVGEGTAWSSICAAAAAEDVDLIVCATHGRSGLQQLVLGSVAERVVRHAPCATLTVRVTASS